MRERIIFQKSFLFTLQPAQCAQPGVVDLRESRMENGALRVDNGLSPDQLLLFPLVNLLPVVAQSPLLLEPERPLRKALSLLQTQPRLAVLLVASGTRERLLQTESTLTSMTVGLSLYVGGWRKILLMLLVKVESVGKFWRLGPKAGLGGGLRLIAAQSLGRRFRSCRIRSWAAGDRQGCWDQPGGWSTCWKAAME